MAKCPDIYAHVLSSRLKAANWGTSCIEGKDYRIVERPARLYRECDLRAYCDAKNWNFRKDGA